MWWLRDSGSQQVADCEEASVSAAGQDTPGSPQVPVGSYLGKGSHLV